MSLSLLDYHSLETGELNRLWYEENDPRARDAFRQRWWLGGDPIAGKDLLSEYHTQFMHQCFERGVLAEEHQVVTFRHAVRHLVENYPPDPIPKFEDAWRPVVDHAIEETRKSLPIADARDAAADRAAFEAALAGLEEDAQHLRAWAAGSQPELSAEAWESVLVSARALLRAVDGDAGALLHPLVRTEEPPPSRLDESVAVPHFGAAPLFAYAAQGGTLGKREDAHIEWCQPCRQRCVGALLLLRRMRRAFGGDVPALPEISPEFDQILQKDDLGIPNIDASRRTQQESRGTSRTGVIVTALIVLTLIVLALIAS